MGYDRIKEKVRTVRKDYLKAVTEGRRFGSVKIVMDNWDSLKDLWKGSPAVEALVNASGAISST